MRRVRRALLALSVLVLVAFSGARHAVADGPVLHEFIPPDPNEDLALHATTRDGRLPAAVDTPSGVLPAPPDRRAPPENAYGGNATPDSIDASYRIDGDTTRPEVVSYDDPFIPAVTPFKRLYAYDAVDESVELIVSDRRLRKVETGGVALPGEDQFFADLFVDAAPGVPVRIPSPGPGARILATRVEPASPIEIVRDGADNWFLVGTTRQRIRLVLELAVPRASFGSPFPDVSWGSLVPRVPLLPRAVRDVARDVLHALGLSQSVSPRDALAALVAHFRAFAPSEDLPRSRLPAELYRELALSKKGVCRHRAFAFTITALALGLPTRLVRNEAHAWVEVGDGAIWHRIDLGGAAGRFELDPGAQAQLHVPPDDPFVWPPGAQSAAGALSASGLAPGAGNVPTPGAAPSGSSQAASAPTATEPSSDAPPATSAEPSNGRPAAQIELGVEGAEARRGAHLKVHGAVASEGEGCPGARVDLALRAQDGRLSPLGSVPTDAHGRFAAELTVPLALAVGDYALVATTPGAGLCGASR
ncbi:MAG TPA: transglutaminase domain-containing protein [Polyangiaceae bacterium]|nr:transglutaminase domain-containing protein [Polyangiaceae bacterium]